MLVKSSAFDEEKLRELVEFYANDVDDFDQKPFYGIVI